MGTVFKYVFNTIGLDAFVKGTSNVNKNLDKTDDSIKDVNLHIEKTKDGFKNMHGFTGRIHDSFENLKTQALGLKDFLTGIPKIMSVILAQSYALAVSLGPYLLIIGAVIGGLLLLKKMYDLNIGGIATSFSKVMGNIKAAWAKITLEVNKFLKEFAPAFKVIGTLMVWISKLAYPIFKILFATLKIALFPIILQMRIMGKLIKYVKGNIDGWIEKFNQVKKTLIDLYKRSGMIGKILSVPIKYLITNFKLLYGIAKGVILLFTDGWSAAFESMKKTIADFIDFIPDFLLPEGVKNWKNQVLAEADKTAAAGVTNNTSNRVDNSQRNVVINTSKEISPQNGQAVGNIIARELSY